MTVQPRPVHLAAGCLCLGSQLPDVGFPTCVSSRMLNFRGSAAPVLFPGNLGTLRRSITLASSQGEQTQSIHSELAKGDVREYDVRKIRENQCYLATEEHIGQPVPHPALKGEAQLLTQGTAQTPHLACQSSKLKRDSAEMKMKST